MKTNKRNRKKHNAEPRVIGRLTAAVIVAALSVNGYYAYTMFGGDIAAAAIYKGMSDEQIALQQEREALKQQEEDSGYIFFTPAASGGDLNMVIVGESDAEAVFGELRYELDLIDMSDTFPLAYSRSNEYFDVYTLQQYHDGIEVYGHEIKLTADKSGNLMSVTGDPTALEDFDTTVKLSEEDAYALAEKYLSSECQLSLETVFIQKKGKRIFLEAVDVPSMGYLFEVVMPLGENINVQLYRIMVYANEKKVAFAEALTQNATRSMDLQGQQVMQTLDVFVDENGQTEYLIDDVRNIAVVTDIEELDDNRVNLIYEEIDGCDSGTVDFFANAQRAYDFYEENFGYHRDMLRLCVDDAAEYVNGTSWYIDGINANASRVLENNSGNISLTRDKTLAIHLDGVAHEYSHVMFPANVPANTAINEGLADLFGELTEDYSDGGFNNSCNWFFTNKNAVHRNIADPHDSGLALHMSDVNDPARETISGNEKYYASSDFSFLDYPMEYYSSTIVSHSAYLMTQGINGTQALTTEQLANLYFYILDDIGDGWNFIAFRALVEDNALQMQMAGYGNGVYADEDDGFVMTDSQFESVVDAFDRVGVERCYDYSLVPDAKIKVYDINNEIYDNYHLKITKFADGSSVVDEDVKSNKYTLPDLDKGLYQFTLTDLDNADRILTYTVMINDNASGQQSKKYDSKGKFLTDFCAKEKEAVLVLDVSGSMDGTPLKETKNAAMRFVKTVLKANPEVKISLITYSDSANTILESTNSKFDLYWAISNLRSGGGTYMCSALTTAESILMQENIKDKYVIVMSDGMPADSPAGAAESIIENDIILCSLGFYHSSSEGAGLMQSIASPGYYYNVQNAADIQGVFDEIARQVSGDEYSIRRIACPVDVIVSYNGETLCSAEENQNLRTSFGSITFEGEEGEIKVLRLDEKADYEICIYGTGTGTMDYTVSYVDENGDYTDVRSFEDVPIKEKTVISTRSAESARTLLEVDTDGDGKFDLKYSGRSGEQGKETIDSLLIFAVILPAVILVLWLVLEIVLLIRRIRKNYICSGCGSRIAGSTSFCGKCGGQIIRTPVMPGWKRLSRGKKGLRIFQLSVTAVCLMLTLMTTFVYRSAANTVYLQLKNSERVSAEMLYQNSVQDTKLPKLYLSAVTELYLDKVQKELLSEKLDDTEASAIYQTVADMEMGDASDTAKDALKKLSAEEYAEDKQIMN